MEIKQYVDQKKSNGKKVGHQHDLITKKSSRTLKDMLTCGKIYTSYLQNRHEIQIESPKTEQDIKDLLWMKLIGA